MSKTFRALNYNSVQTNEGMLYISSFIKVLILRDERVPGQVH